MTKEKEKKILLDAFLTFGPRHQVIKAIEEMAELTCELSRIQDGRTDPKDIIGELADVSIMLDQLILTHDEEEFKKVRAQKLARLNNRIRKEKKAQAKKKEAIRKIDEMLKKNLDTIDNLMADMEKFTKTTKK